MRTINLHTIIPSHLKGVRLDIALADLFPQYSRSQIQTWIRSGQVMVNGHPPLRARDKVETNQAIEIKAELEPKESWEAQPIPLDIIYQDEFLLIINKPAGLTVHPGAGNRDRTLVNALVNYDANLALLPRAGLIHRLDKDTSGLLVIARTLEAHNQLVSAMQAREIKREYLAVVNGVMISGGCINVPIGRHPTHRTRMAVTDNGREAITHYRVLERFQAHTLLHIQLETGRTHQIRVHLTHLGYPIIGDRTYNKYRTIAEKLPEKVKKNLAQIKRQVLHACDLSLVHPITNKLLHFQSPPPADMAELIHTLKESKEP